MADDFDLREARRSLASKDFAQAGKLYGELERYPDTKDEAGAALRIIALRSAIKAYEWQQETKQAKKFLKDKKRAGALPGAGAGSAADKVKEVQLAARELDDYLISCNIYAPGFIEAFEPWLTTLLYASDKPWQDERPPFEREMCYLAESFRDVILNYVLPADISSFSGDQMRKMNQLLELALELELMFTVQQINVNGDFEVELGKPSRVESPYKKRIICIYKALSELIGCEISPETKKYLTSYGFFGHDKIFLKEINKLVGFYGVKGVLHEKSRFDRFNEMKDSLLERQGRGPVDLINIREHVPADLRKITEIKEARAYVSEEGASLPAKKRVLVVPRQFGCLAAIGIISAIDFFLIAQIKAGNFNHVAEHWTLRGMVVLLVAILVLDVWRSYFRKDEP